MGKDIELACRCGEVHGVLRDAAASNVNRVVCYCDDCQAFLHHLGRSDILDAFGGTDIVQAAPSAVRYDRGADRIACVRLSEKGLLRFYASCCKTPLGNTVGPAVPFVGMASEVFRDLPDSAARDGAFGPARCAMFGQFAVGTTSKPKRPTLGMIAHASRLMLGWKLRGRAWPHPFFERGRKDPVPPVTVLSREEREALRPLCGPKA